LDDSAARVLARLADGGMRDGLSLLDQCASATTGELTAERVYACLGIAGIQECGQLMSHIAARNSTKALALMNRLYAEGKDMGALLDELACLTRDFMIMKTAPQEGISMLSGVATDRQVQELATQFSSGELVRMMNLIQTTVAGFTRSSSRRMDAELCVLNMCQPELELDAQSLNARLTRVEEQISTGSFVAAPMPAPQRMEDEEDRPPMPDDADAPPVADEAPTPPADEAPVGFWMDVAAAVRKELKPPVVGFFAPTPNGPLQGVLRGGKLVLECANTFTMEIINKPEVLALVARKASVKLGTQVSVAVVDKSAASAKTEQMEQLLQFGRAHSNIVNIKNQ